MTYDEAKQQVADEWGYDLNNNYLSEAFYKDVAEKYARNLANEKVKECRASIKGSILVLEHGYVDLILPLPFSDEQ